MEKKLSFHSTSHLSLIAAQGGMRQPHRSSSLREQGGVVCTRAGKILSETWHYHNQ